MSLSLRFLLILLCLLTVPAFGAIEMTIACTQQGSSALCNATTVNRGGIVTGTGLTYTGFMVNGPPSSAMLSEFTNSLGLTQCFDSHSFPGNEGSAPFIFCFDFAGAIAPGASFTTSVRVTSTSGVASLSVGAFSGFVGEEGEPLSGFVFTDITPPSCNTVATIPPIVNSGVQYALTWTPVSQAGATYEVQESTSPDFAGAQTLTTTTPAATFTHTVTANTTYYYRVRALTCNGSPGGYSATVSTVVSIIPTQVISTEVLAVAPFGTTTPVRIPVRIPGAGPGATFTASIDKPYLGVSPASGSLPTDGITIDIVGDPRDLPPGASTGTLTVVIETPTFATAGRVTPHAVTTTTTPVSVTLVTPVTPGTKTTPGDDALIIPVVTHVNGAAGPFLSDVRLTNDSNASTTYQVTLTPTRTDATQSRSTKVTVASGQTVALNDIVKNFFGVGATADPNDAGSGPLDIRVVGSTNNLTFASSRTYAKTATGTFGQYIAAVPFSRFASNAVNVIPIPGQTPTVPVRSLSLQQIAQSSKFRTNLGLVEGSGSPANGKIRVMSVSGTQLAEIPYSLMAGEQQQINQFLALNGITNLEDGRIEITVDSSTGAVSAYASVLDNITSDPLAVMPVNVEAINSTRYILPGVADLPGAANFHSDIRVFNGGTAAATVNMTYYPQGNPDGAASTTPVLIAPGEVKVFDNVLPTVFNRTTTGGSILMTTATPSSLVVTGRTYSIGSNNGTFGQFIPGVTPTEGIGIADRALQVLQLEQSKTFRSNVGLVELTGNAARVEVKLILPDTKATPTIEVPLRGNEFVQLNSIIEQTMGLRDVYNARVTVKVIGGTGRVTAYGSVIDNATQDPTYVPAQ